MKTMEQYGYVDPEPDPEPRKRPRRLPDEHPDDIQRSERMYEAQWDRQGGS